MNKARELFSSRTATVLTMIGVAVGLGNVWRFPYMMGSHGGSAFLFVYILFVLLFGIPAVMAEWSLGRASRSGPIGAFSLAFGKPAGTAVGVLLTATVLTANSYYLVVVSQVVFSVWFSAARGFSNDNISEYGDHLTNGPLIAALAISLLVLGLGLVALGLRRGIQRVSTLFVPFFGIIVLYMIFHAFSLPGASAKFVEFLRPDFSELSTTNVFAAMGQAIFSLSLGGTFFVIYGSYLRAEENIPVSAFFTAIGDVSAAVLAALFLVPAMLVFEVNLAHGPGLVFETLPLLFIELPAGRVVGTFFLFAFALMAFLSSLAALQVGVGGIQDYFDLPTAPVIAGVGIFELILIVLTSMQQGLIGPMDLIFGSGMQCLGCLLACLALAWGLGTKVTGQQIFGDRKSWLTSFLVAWIRWIVPLVIVVVLMFATDMGQKLFGLL